MPSCWAGSCCCSACSVPSRSADADVSLLAFAFFVIGFAFTLGLAPLGFAVIVLGGWLMLRAWRLQKYGTTNSRQVAREAATRPSRKVRQQAAKDPGEADRPQGADGQQALHAQGAQQEEDPQARARRLARHVCSAAGMTRAECSRFKTSALRRTSERAVGSSPRARITSTSVTMPITVE